jgi:ATP-dependent metalloprotease FtsH
LKNVDIISELKNLKKSDAIIIGETESSLNTGLNSRDNFIVEIPNVTFDQVIGLDHVKKQVEFISTYLKNPEAYSNINIRLPKGILFTGMPGCGKTLMAKAIATMAGVPVLIINGSDFINKYVGEGARKVRELFAMAKVEAPVIIFIDEIDAIGGKRSTSGEGGEKEYTQTLNALLTEMDGFATGNNNVIVIASTNRDTNYLDPALNRRFENKYHFSLPTLSDRFNIFQLYLKSVPCNADVSIKDLAAKTYGLSGANIEYIVNLSKYIALERMKLDNIPLSKFEILNIDIINAYNTFTIGYEIENISINDREFYKTAIHESGHTLCMCLQKNYPRIFELVTITPRDAGNGTILGFAQNFDKEEFKSYSKENFEQLIIVSLGGLVAEEIFFNESFDGVGSDLAHASSLARAMVKKFGMTDKILYSSGDDELSLIEREVIEGILFDCKAKCKELLLNNKNLLEKLANELFIKKTLTHDEVYKIIKKKYNA